MIIVEKAKYTSGVLLSGDFFDFDRLFFAIVKFIGTHEAHMALTTNVHFLTALLLFF